MKTCCSVLQTCDHSLQNMLLLLKRVTRSCETCYYLLSTLRRRAAPRGTLYNHGVPPFAYQKTPIVYQKRLIVYQKRPIAYQKRPIVYQTRPILYQKRPIVYQTRLLKVEDVRGTFDAQFAGKNENQTYL